MATSAAGREALVDNAELAAEMTRAGAKALGIEAFHRVAGSGANCDLNAPAGVDSSAIVKEFRESFSAVVANGQGDMKGQLFGIAHIGYYDYLDTIGILAALELVLASRGNRLRMERGESGAGSLCAQNASRTGVAIAGLN